MPMYRHIGGLILHLKIWVSVNIHASNQHPILDLIIVVEVISKM